MTDRSLKTSSPPQARKGSEPVKKTADPATAVGFAHTSVMAREVIAWLRDTPAGWLVDCTAGGAGHSAALLRACPEHRLLALDRDPTAVATARERLAAFGDRATVVHAPFSELAAALDDLGIVELSGVLADLGVSSHQFDVAERGFSIRHDGPLDMRMDPSRGAPLFERLAGVSERDLADVLYNYGDIRASRKTAALVLSAWRDGADSTVALAERLSSRLPRSGRIHPATRVFQALRIWVNDEFGELDTLLQTAPQRLAVGGAMAVISFHSGEDRYVKRAFAAIGRGKRAAFELLTRKPLQPQADECDANPRARSARLRGLRRKPPQGRKHGEIE